jgi:diguanylate cyclase (GGDEF)-like protein
MEQAVRLAGLAIERAGTGAQLARQALHDPLTGLANRTLFLDRLGHALARLDRSRSSVAVLFMDLDGFKLINDSLGHEGGDQLLVTAARRLGKALRRSDTAARLGGDELTVLCEDIGDVDAALTIARRLGTVMAEPFVLESRSEASLTVSVGIAVASSADGTSAEGLLGDAEAAMYRAKERGKARCELFEPTRDISDITGL